MSGRTKQISESMLLSAVCSQRFGDIAIWIAAVPMLVGFALMFVKEDICGEQE